MKKFLSKKPVMIAFIVAAVAFLAIYIGMLVRPVSYGMTYKITKKEDGVTYTNKVKVHSDKWAKSTSILEMDGEKSETVTKVWIYRDGNYIVQLGTKEVIKAEDGEKEAMEAMIMKEDAYEEAVKFWKDLKEEDKDAYEEALKEAGAKVNAFTWGEDDTQAKCAGAVVFTVIGGVIELVLIAGAAMALVYRKKA